MTKNRQKQKLTKITLVFVFVFFCFVFALLLALKSTFVIDLEMTITCARKYTLRIYNKIMTLYTLQKIVLSLKLTTLFFFSLLILDSVTKMYNYYLIILIKNKMGTEKYIFEYRRVH